MKEFKVPTGKIRISTAEDKDYQAAVEQALTIEFFERAKVVSAEHNLLLPDTLISCGAGLMAQVLDASHDLGRDPKYHAEAGIEMIRAYYKLITGKELES